ncbi:MAG TPA: HPF/RaiA family ribosome-associated protein [Gemmatimonadaceae bacterium]|nr:HPF/RaiA family ribosome-associated protein [Gemmatimonadaceae bacterium]
MEIIFHAHHATISDSMRRRAEAGVRRIGRRIGRAVDAVIRFEQDGPVKRVEVVLHAPSKRDLVARAESRYFGLALTASLDRLSAQARSLGKASVIKRTRAARLAAEA